MPAEPSTESLTSPQRALWTQKAAKNLSYGSPRVGEGNIYVL